MQHKNFFETPQEAQMRLRGTVVLYDGEPYLVQAITGHHKDGIFRIYMEPTGLPLTQQCRHDPDCPIRAYSADSPELGTALDRYIKARGENTHLIRKQMNSPLFDRFRPFPLGIVNLEDEAIYTARAPTRKSEQGLTANMLTYRALGSDRPIKGVDITSKEMRDAILGKYPTANEVLAALTNPNVATRSIGFHREFGFARGPIEIPFLTFRDRMVGVVPNGDTSYVKLGGNHKHLRESVEELHLFNDIRS